MEENIGGFPNDDIGKTLLALKNEGDDFSVPRDIEFFIEFKTEEAALNCGSLLFKNSYRVELSPPSDEEPDAPWTVIVVPHLQPTYEDISSLNDYFEKVAVHFQGHTSGWGCEAVGAP